MTKEFQKAIFIKGRLKNTMNKNPSAKNLMAYKRQRNLCVSPRRKNIKSLLNNVTKRGITANKNLDLYQAICNKQRILHLLREIKLYLVKESSQRRSMNTVLTLFKKVVE